MYYLLPIPSYRSTNPALRAGTSEEKEEKKNIEKRTSNREGCTHVRVSVLLSIFLFLSFPENILFVVKASGAGSGAIFLSSLLHLHEYPLEQRVDEHHAAGSHDDRL